MRVLSRTLPPTNIAQNRNDASSSKHTFLKDAYIYIIIYIDDYRCCVSWWEGKLPTILVLRASSSAWRLTSLESLAKATHSNTSSITHNTAVLNSLSTKLKAVSCLTSSTHPRMTHFMPLQVSSEISEHQEARLFDQHMREIQSKTQRSKTQSSAACSRKFQSSGDNRKA